MPIQQPTHCRAAENASGISVKGRPKGRKRRFLNPAAGISIFLFPYPGSIEHALSFGRQSIFLVSVSSQPRSSRTTWAGLDCLFLPRLFPLWPGIAVECKQCPTQPVSKASNLLFLPPGRSVGRANVSGSLSFPLLLTPPPRTSPLALPSLVSLFHPGFSSCTLHTHTRTHFGRFRDTPRTRAEAKREKRLG